MSKKGTRKQLAENAIKRAKANVGIDTYDTKTKVPPGGIESNRKELRHNNTYGPLPYFYMDKLVICHDCGAEEVWTARKQQWWYEEAKGNINSEAIYCKECRAQKRQHKENVRDQHLAGLARKNEQAI
ncbi:Probable zinc-ribbon domain-containing protein [Alteromonadaceae bacterium Bs31]|nr:Probable zinc-ribbon domain-containing protein [Alteromonadaceae bacterium Bs31]